MIRLPFSIISFANCRASYPFAFRLSYDIAPDPIRFLGCRALSASSGVSHHFCLGIRSFMAPSMFDMNMDSSPLSGALKQVSVSAKTRVIFILSLTSGIRHQSGSHPPPTVVPFRLTLYDAVSAVVACRAWWPVPLMSIMRVYSLFAWGRCYPAGRRDFYLRQPFVCAVGQDCPRIRGVQRRSRDQGSFVYSAKTTVFRPLEMRLRRIASTYRVVRKFQFLFHHEEPYIRTRDIEA